MPASGYRVQPIPAPGCDARTPPGIQGERHLVEPLVMARHHIRRPSISTVPEVRPCVVWSIFARSATRRA